MTTHPINRLHRRRRWVWLGAVLLAAAACASNPDQSTGPPGEPGMADLRYSCGRHPFPADLPSAPRRNDERASNPAADALREHLLLPGPDVDFLPDEGWTLVGMDAVGAEFVTVGDGGQMTFVTVQHDGGTWAVTGWGECRPRIVLGAGLDPAEWAWGSPGVPGPDTRVFEALVTELSCASGRSSEGRVVGPEIVRAPRLVLVVFAVRPLGGLVQTCPSNPSTPVTVDLGEPLGDRRLLDGSRIPFVDPTQPRP